MFKPRPPQRDVLNFSGGKMGVSAVPGSGKTQTLSALAARLIASGLVGEDQEVLIVTLVNSAVNNFSSRVSGFIQEYGLLPDFGYRVRTLHGLAHDIVKQRPSLVGLSDRFTILDQRESEEILSASATNWLRSHPDFAVEWTDPKFDLLKDSRTLKSWYELATKIGNAFIRTAKDQQISATDIQTKLNRLNVPLPLLQMGTDIYADYQRALSYRSAVDFDDLIRLALQALRTDPDLLKRLQYQWPFILEDEAQDSSRLQEEILRLLSGEQGNWVRVGDPNQAIFETFTTADPRFLRNFLTEPGVTALTLPHSGRSTRSIITLANALQHWTHTSHPMLELREALVEPDILPTPLDDPQPNPPDDPAAITLYMPRLEVADEVSLVVKSIKKWFSAFPASTVAVLVPRNERGAQMVSALKEAGVETLELLRSSLSTRQAAQQMAAVLRHLADPTHPNRLVALFNQLIPVEISPEEKLNYEQAAKLIKSCTRVEEYLWPRPDLDWMAGLSALSEPVRLILDSFRQLVRRWQSASLLPVDQLILTTAQDLFTHPVDLALAHKMALLLQRDAAIHPEWGLVDFSAGLEQIAQNQRSFAGFSEEDTGFNPDDHPGKVVVATMHKAKGLEWDRVYMLSVNNYDFPSGDPEDDFISEKFFIRNRLNLEAEVVERLKALVSGDLPGLYLEDGEYTRQARWQYASERLRLLYVGITRARKSLVLTWNTGRKGPPPRQGLSRNFTSSGRSIYLTLPADFQFSQNNLQDYADCARRFELRHLMRLQWPALRTEPVMEMEKHMQQGERFHRMAQQHILGLPVGSITPAEQDLQRWWDNFEMHQPLETLPPQRYPEYFLGAPLGGFRLVAKYDLIAIQPGENAVIMDWKTSLKRPKATGLRMRWQSRIYPYLLSLAGSHLNGGIPIPPAKIQMIYWFTDYPNEPEIIAYTQEQFDSDHCQLLSVIQRIQATQPGQFMLTDDENRCLFCNFRSLCDTGVAAGDWHAQETEPEDTSTAPLEINLDQIGEIEF